MKKGDYQSIKKAKIYHSERFANGLKVVHLDESDILHTWMNNKVNAKSHVFLDVGAGTGRITRELLAYSPSEMITLDASAYMLSVLKDSLTSEQRKKLTPIKAKADHIPLKDNSVDLITCFHLFKHLPKAFPILSEFSRLLKPGGYCLFDFLNSQSIAPLRLGTCHAYSLSSIKSDLEKLNLKTVDSKSLHIFGESVYNLGEPLAHIIHQIDNSMHNIKIGTKLIVLAQKSS